AHRAGLRRVLMPAHNEADLDDMPADLRKEMQFVMLTSIDQVLREALMARRPVVLNGGNGLETTVVARAGASSRARPAPAHRRATKAKRRPVARPPGRLDDRRGAGTSAAAIRADTTR